MKNINGIEIQKLSFTAQKLGDLIYYEGPLLSLYVDTENPGLYYLYKWADCDENVNRWLIAQTNEATLRKFFSKKDSLRNIILNNAIIYVVDLNDNLEQTHIQVSATTELLQEYLPDVQSYFVEEQYTDFANEFKATIENVENDAAYSTIRSSVYNEFRKSLGYILNKPVQEEKLVEVFNDLVEINKKWNLRTGS